MQNSFFVPLSHGPYTFPDLLTQPALPPATCVAVSPARSSSQTKPGQACMSPPAWMYVFSYLLTWGGREMMSRHMNGEPHL